MSKRVPLTTSDVGAAMMAWFGEQVRTHPAGLVTQAQAAVMLGVSRMAVSRLVGRGHLRAVHFPRPPEIAGVSVGRDDPTWLRVAGWLGLDPAEADVRGLPKVCYVSFADVVRLWQAGEARKACRRDWGGPLAAPGIGPGEPAAAEPEHAPPPAGPEELETWML